MKRASFEVPETLVERHMSARTENAARGLALQGIDPTKIGVNWRDYRENQREDSVQAAKADILLDEIARREGLEVPDAELESRGVPPRRAHEAAEGEAARAHGEGRRSRRAARTPPRGEDP